MTPTHKERLLADILAALLRIEALMQREKVADSEVDWWVRRLSQPRPAPLPNADMSKLPGIKRVIGDPPHAFTGSPPGMPEPPIAPVRPVTTWSSASTCADSSISSPTPAADKANDPSLKQWRTPPAGYMHDGGWIHATGFSMVGP